MDISLDSFVRKTIRKTYPKDTPKGTKGRVVGLRINKEQCHEIIPRCVAGWQITLHAAIKDSYVPPA